MQSYEFTAALQNPQAGVTSYFNAPRPGAKRRITSIAVPSIGNLTDTQTVQVSKAPLGQIWAMGAGTNNALSTGVFPLITPIDWYPGEAIAVIIPTTSTTAPQMISLDAALGVTQAANPVITVGANVPVGRLITVFAAATLLAGGMSASDSAGNVWKPIVSAQYSGSGGWSGAIFASAVTSPLTSGVSTITVNTGGHAGVSAAASFLGASIVGFYATAGTATNTAGPATITSGSITASDLCVAFDACSITTFTSTTQPAGFTVLETANAGTQNIVAGYQIPAAAGALTYSKALTGSDPWTSLTAGFSAASTPLPPQAGGFQVLLQGIEHSL